MRITKKQQARLLEIQIEHFAGLYQFAIKRKVDEDTGEMLPTAAEISDEAPDDYINRFAKKTVIDIKNREFISLVQKKKDDEKPTIFHHPFIPNSSDLHQMRGMVKKLGRWRKNEIVPSRHSILANEDYDIGWENGYQHAIRDFLMLNKKLLQRHPTNHLFQDRTCLKCAVPFKNLGSAVASQRGYVHNKCPTKEELGRIEKCIHDIPKNRCHECSCGCSSSNLVHVW